jgi:hypothetical protein
MTVLNANNKAPNLTSQTQVNGDTNKFEVLGRPLSSLPTVRINYKNGYKEDVPKIVFLLTTYFLENSKHFTS